MTAETSNSRRVWLTAAWMTVSTLLLVAPLVAMQFTSEVNWTISDFVLAGSLLFGAGGLYELASRAGNLFYRAAVGVALGAGILIMVASGAVGIIGSENNPGNLLYLGVVALAAASALVARGRASAMVWAMIFAAVATVLVPVIALAGVAQPASDVLSPEVFAATAIFAGMWLLSAWLFRKSQAASTR